MDFLRTADPQALDLAVSAARRALDLLPQGHIEHDVSLSILGNLLVGRFGAVGAEADLAEANALLAESIAQSSPEGFAWPILISQYAGGVMDQYALTGDTAELERAAALLETALRKAPLQDRPVVANALGAALARLGHLDRSISAHREAVAGTGAGGPSTGAAQIGLGSTYLHRYTVTGDPADLDAGIAELTSALANLSRRHLPYVHAAAALGKGLSLRYAVGRDPGDASLALALFRAGAANESAPTLDRATSAAAWARLAESMNVLDDALTGYETAAALLDLVAWRGLPPADRERVLAGFGGLAAAAAACALATGHPERAVELLEQARGVLLAQLIDDRSADARVRRLAPALAKRLARLNGLLDTPDDPIARPPLTMGPMGDDAGARERRMTLARERETVLAELRKVPGLEDFLLRPRLDQVRPKRGDGPVVIVNVAPLRSDLIVVTDRDLTVVELPGDLPDQVVVQADTVLAATSDAPAGETPAQPADASGDELMAGVLDWLWHTICGPALAALPPGTDRVWWCPIGVTALLPLHAAAFAHADGPSVLDSVVSSYAPTLRVLRRSRELVTDRRNGMLAVLPEPPGHPKLSGADEIGELAGAGLPITTLIGSAAGRADVLAALPDHTWLHFAGHGKQDLTDPGSGSLLLTDGPLTIREMVRQRHPGGTAAFLSSCESAAGGGPDLADEVLTMVTALQLAGFRHSIGTLWAIPDLVAVNLVEWFYAAYEKHPGDLSGALREATLRLRHRYAGHPTAWAGAVHVGP
ncbi:CHAT domain-containing protein [Streptosporangiaceae bacterium NEAU-GS5]|nr:CHAT domain-containing protein [Streptosporangiaceae bacterium NEAU-GS5]